MPCRRVRLIKKTQQPTSPQPTCRQDSLQNSFHICLDCIGSNTRAQSQDFVPTRWLGDGLFCTVDSHICTTIAFFFLVRQSKSPEDREFRRRFARLWEVLVPKLREVFSDHDPTIDCRAQVVNVYDRRGGVGKTVFRFAPEGHEHRFTISSPGLCARHITDVVLQQIVVVEASTLAQDRTAHV